MNKSHNLRIDEKLGRLEGMASKYGNLGLIYHIRGELDNAEEAFKKSLEISETRGMLKLTANQYCNLGAIYERRGDNDKARRYWEKALGLYKKIGMPHKVEKVEGFLERNKDK